MSISILGAGSWGSALAVLFSQIDDVILWSNDKEQIKNIKTVQANEGYLPQSILFPQNVIASDDFSQTMGSKLVVIATPIAALREMLIKIKASKNMPDIICVCK